MALFKQAGSDFWWIDINVDGKRVRRSTKTTDRKLAQRYHDELKSQVWRKEYLNETEDVPFKDVVRRYLVEKSDIRSAGKLRRSLDWWVGKIGGVPVRKVDANLISQVMSERLAGIKKTSANRYLCDIRAVLHKAAKWKLITVAPDIEMYEAKELRVRYLTKDELQRLFKELPDYLKAIVQFSLVTGLRESNVVKLKWSQVNIDQRLVVIDAFNSKGKRAIPVPLNDVALQVIERQKGKHSEYVFVGFYGKPLARANNQAWRDALKRAGITDYRWHDNRHTWASYAAMAGLSERELMELGGWSSTTMVSRYAAFSSHRLLEASQRAAGFCHSAGSFSAIASQGTETT